jgi:hypothetical protein
MSVLQYYSKQFEITFEMIRDLFRPRKKETLLYFEEIGLTLAVPGWLNVLTKRQIEARFKKLATTSEKFAATGDKLTTSFATGDNCRTLFIARHAEYYYMSGIMISLDGRRPIDAKNEYYEFEHKQVNELKDRYINYAKVVVDEQSVDGVIGGINFEKSVMTARVPGETLYSVYCYHGFHAGYQILLTATFSGERKGMELVQSIEKARFS